MRNFIAENLLYFVVVMASLALLIIMDVSTGAYFTSALAMAFCYYAGELKADTRHNVELLEKEKETNG